MSCPFQNEGYPFLAVRSAFVPDARAAAYLHSTSRRAMHFLQGYMFVLSISRLRHD